MITDRVERYEELEQYDADNNSIQRVLLSDEAQAEAVLEAEDSGLYAGYSEMWEDGFKVQVDDEDEKGRVEREMDRLYISIFEVKISDFLDALEEEEEEEEEEKL